MRYGVPYTGSKNSIAEWVIDHLPPAENFVDLFCGGCAVTHAAMLSGRYRRFIENDINADITQFFIDCMRGKYTTENHKDFISSEVFRQKKDIDTYISIVWSFGNNRLDYLYGSDKEDIKRAFHNAIMFDDYAELEKHGYNCKTKETDIALRYADIKSQVKRKENDDVIARLGNLERLYNLEQLSKLQADNIKIFNKDYADIEIPENSVVYCDIPYYGTRTQQYKAGSDFDYDRFYEWAEKQDNIYISEYNMPDPFIEVGSIEKTVLCANTGSLYATERLYTNKKTLKKNPHLADYEQILFF